MEAGWEHYRSLGFISPRRAVSGTPNLSFHFYDKT
jgi:hypothetical protein